MIVSSVPVLGEVASPPLIGWGGSIHVVTFLPLVIRPSAMDDRMKPNDLVQETTPLLGEWSYLDNNKNYPKRLVLRVLLVVVVGMVVSSLQFFGFHPGHIVSFTKSSSSLSLTSMTTTSTLLLGSSNNNNNNNHDGPYRFPDSFVFGTATSSFQIEGGVNDRGWTIWDDFCSRTPSPIMDHSNGDVACDSYHYYSQDVQLLVELQIPHYRFSIAWSRLFPTGTETTPHPDGVAYYHALIDDLVRHNITPWITLYHWDLPMTLQQDYGGWTNTSTAVRFATLYAKTVFAEFGTRVKHWITLNEAWTVAINGHGTGIHAPGHNNHPTTEPYLVGHNLLLAHAMTVHVYRTHFSKTQGGTIGIANCGDYRYPKTNHDNDREAAERAMEFQFGWFVDPLVFGDYPTSMRQRLGHRLPQFTRHEQELLKGSFDFLGLNYYSSLLASEPATPPTYGGYWADIFVDFSNDSTVWRQNAMGWNVAPDGLREMLHWIAHRYHNPLLYITENGSAEDESDLPTAIADTLRREFLQDHLIASAQAMEEGVNVGGYFAWSLMDNFEWQFGYQRKFGLCHVNFDGDLERTPKSSGLFYNQTIVHRGRNLPRKNLTRRMLARERQAEAEAEPEPEPIRSLPERVLIGYGNNLEHVRRAVRGGVNVVIWAFMDIVSCDDDESQDVWVETDRRRTEQCHARLETNLDIEGIRQLITDLDEEGYDDTIHLVSSGGWNGPHLDPKLSSLEWYLAFKELIGDVFHGIDWDLEGHDNLDSPTNVFSVECLEKVGAISQMAKADGYLIGMAPPQSYLDVEGDGRFSRFVNLTDPDRTWHGDFHYFGANVYAYLLANHGRWIDFVSIQFYESYSRAAMSVFDGGETGQPQSPAEYLQNFVNHAKNGSFVYEVMFDTDPDVEMTTRNVTLPLSKTVLGFANGWADNDNDKTLYISPEQVQIAWSFWKANGRRLPRGFMFWTIEEEGSNGVNFSQSLSQILQNR